MDILTDTNYDFNVWYNTYDPNFIDICAKSKVPEKWVSYDRVLRKKYANSVIKPVNIYVENLYPKPELVSIDKNMAVLRQHNHAEILLLETDGILKALDRPWIRQFYKSNHKIEPVGECFLDSFVAYVPWFIDADSLISISESPNSPLQVYDKQYRYTEISKNAKYVEPAMIPFRFKRNGPHMESKNVGKIKRYSPIFDIKIEADDIIIKRIEEFYEND